MNEFELLQSLNPEPDRRGNPGPLPRQRHWRKPAVTLLAAAAVLTIVGVMAPLFRSDRVQLDTADPVAAAATAEAATAEAAAADETPQDGDSQDSDSQDSDSQDSAPQDAVSLVSSTNVPFDVVASDGRFFGISRPQNPSQNSASPTSIVSVVASDDGWVWEPVLTVDEFAAGPRLVASPDSVDLVAIIADSRPGTSAQALLHIADVAGAARRTITPLDGSPVEIAEFLLVNAAASPAGIGLHVIGDDRYVDPGPLLAANGYDLNEACDFNRTRDDVSFRICGTEEVVTLDNASDGDRVGPQSVHFGWIDGDGRFDLNEWPTEQPSGPGWLYPTTTGIGVTLRDDAVETEDGTTWQPATTGDIQNAVVASRGTERVARSLVPELGSPGNPTLAYTADGSTWVTVDIPFDDSVGSRSTTSYLQAGAAGWVLTTNEQRTRSSLDDVEIDRQDDATLFTLTAEDGATFEGRSPAGPVTLKAADGATIRTWPTFEMTTPHRYGWSVAGNEVRLTDEAGSTLGRFDSAQWRAVTSTALAYSSDVWFSSNGTDWRQLATGLTDVSSLAVGDDRVLVSSYPTDQLAEPALAVICLDTGELCARPDGFVATTPVERLLGRQADPIAYKRWLAESIGPLAEACMAEQGFDGYVYTTTLLDDVSMLDPNDEFVGFDVATRYRDALLDGKTTGGTTDDSAGSDDSDDEVRTAGERPGLDPLASPGEIDRYDNRARICELESGSVVQDGDDSSADAGLVRNHRRLDARAQLTDPRVLDALDGWRECMAVAGHDADSPGAIQAALTERAEAIIAEGLSRTDTLAALDALLDEELELGRLSDGCSTDLHAARQTVRNEIAAQLLGESPVLGRFLVAKPTAGEPWTGEPIRALPGAAEPSPEDPQPLVIPVFDEPGGEPRAMLDINPIDGEERPIPLFNWAPVGSPTVLRVISGEPGDEWAQVAVPTRPHNRSVWVRAADFDWGSTSMRIEIDLAGPGSLSLYDGDELVAEYPIVQGRDARPTPVHLTHLAFGVLADDVAPAYGYAMVGMASFSEELSDFGAGEPHNWLHGTNQPGLIGERVSSGEIRLRNEDLRVVVDRAGPGTPVLMYDSSEARPGRSEILAALVLPAATTEYRTDTGGFTVNLRSLTNLWAPCAAPDLVCRTDS